MRWRWSADLDVEVIPRDQVAAVMTKLDVRHTGDDLTEEVPAARVLWFLEHCITESSTDTVSTTVRHAHCHKRLTYAWSERHRELAASYHTA